jgi:hypothetical protein
MSTKDVMQLLGFAAEESVYALVRSRQLPAYRIASRHGGRARYRFDEVDVERFLQGVRVGDPLPPKPRPMAIPERQRFINPNLTLKRLPAGPLKAKNFIDPSRTFKRLPSSTPKP